MPAQGQASSLRPSIVGTFGTMLRLQYMFNTTSGPVVEEVACHDIKEAHRTLADALKAMFGTGVTPEHERAFLVLLGDLSRQAPVDLADSGKWTYRTTAVSVTLTTA